MEENQGLAGYREFPLRAPPGWRNGKKISARTKRIVLEMQRDKDPTTGKPLLAGYYEFDHRPCVADRDFDPIANDTIPAFDDPRYIFALATPEHAKLSPKDASRIARTKRLQKKEHEHRLAVAAKAAGEDPSAAQRKGPWPKRKLQSRSLLPHRKMAGSRIPAPPVPTSKATTTTTPRGS